MNEFNTLDLVDIYVINIRPEGYVKDLVISVGLGKLGNTKHLIKYFNVHGTKKVFRLDLKYYNEYLSQFGTDESIFESFFKAFRLDYLKWKKSGFKLEWQKEYNKDFNQYIYTL